MNRGDAFWANFSAFGTDHIYVILSEPSQNGGRVLLVNFTTGFGGPRALKITRIQYAGLRHDSEVNFADALDCHVTELENNIAAGLFTKHIDCPIPVVELISAKAKESPAFPNNLKKKYLV